MPEPHIQLTAAALTALRRADAGGPMGALSGLRLATATLAGNAPPALTGRLAHVEAELLCRVGIGQAREVLAGLRGQPTATAARSLARLSLSAGDPATAQQALAPFPSDGATVRGQVEGAILRSIVAAPHDRATALSRLDGALLTAAPLRMRRPFLIHAPGLRELLNARIEAGTAAAAFAVDLMRRMSGQTIRPAAALAEPLTDREQQVLRYLASTLSNAEIASELYLSINTVKTHQRMIYRKLDADGRRDAVRRAKELRLL